MEEHFYIIIRLALKSGIRDRNFRLLPLSSLAPTVSEPLSVNTFGKKCFREQVEGICLLVPASGGNPNMFQNESRREKERGKREGGRGKRADE